MSSILAVSIMLGQRTKVNADDEVANRGAASHSFSTDVKLFAKMMVALKKA